MFHHTKVAVGVLCLAMLAGCSTTRHYAWHNYDTNLYRYYEHDLTAEGLLTELLKAEADATAQKKTLAPGIYADIGTMYLRLGKKVDAIRYYQKEADAWVESKPLMETLIRNLQRQSTSEQKGAQP